MNDATNAKSTIADQIHRAVSTLLETEMRLNGEVSDARELIHQLGDEIAKLRERLASEQDARKRLEQIVGKVAELVT